MESGQAEKVRFSIELTQDTAKGKAYTPNNQKSIISQQEFFHKFKSMLGDVSLRNQLKSFLFYLKFYYRLHVRVLQFS